MPDGPFYIVNPWRCSSERLVRLGAAGGDRYVTDNPNPGHENVAFRMRPEHWLSQDQSRPDAAG